MADGATAGSSMRRCELMMALFSAIVAEPVLRPRRLRPASREDSPHRRTDGSVRGNPDHRAFFAAFIAELTRLNWVDGRNARIEQRWTDADLTRASSYAAELLAQQ